MQSLAIVTMYLLVAAAVGVAFVATMTIVNVLFYIFCWGFVTVDNHIQNRHCNKNKTQKFDYKTQYNNAI